MMKKTKKAVIIIGVLVFTFFLIGSQSAICASVDNPSTDTELSTDEETPPAAEGYQEPAEKKGEYDESIEKNDPGYTEPQDDMPMNVDDQSLPGYSGEAPYGE